MGKNQIIKGISLSLMAVISIIVIIKTYALITSDKIEVLIDSSIFLGKAFSNSLIISAYFLLIKKHLKSIHIAAILVISFILADINFFEDNVHYWLEDLRILTKGKNTQYSRILFSLIPLPFYSFIFRKKSNRTFSRVMSFLSYSILLVVTYLYHSALPNTLIPEAEKLNKMAMESIRELPENDFIQQCQKNKWICHINPDEIKMDQKGLYQFYKDYNLNLKAESFELIGSYYFYQSDITNRFMLMQYKDSKGLYKLIIDYRSIDYFKNKTLVSFYTLQYSLAFFWSLFTWILIYYHRKRKVNHLT